MVTLQELNQKLESHSLPFPAYPLIEGERPLWAVKFRSRKPLQEWQRWRQKAAELGLWPLVLGKDRNALRLLGEGLNGFGEGAPTVQECLTGLDPQAAVEALMSSEDYTPNEGEWPSRHRPGHTFTLVRRSFLFPQEYCMVLVPAERPWEVFAYLNFGGWNENPEARVHCALHKMWFERWGAEPVAFTHDILECRVLRPPSDKGEALELARQQYGYCLDLVEQGTESIQVLADMLLDGTVWSFWWD